MKNTNVIAIAKDNKVFATSMICYALFWGVVILASYNVLDVKTMTAAIGALALVVYGVGRLVRQMSLSKTTPLTLEGVKDFFKEIGLDFSEEKDELSFNVGEAGIPVNLSYAQADNNLSLMIIMITKGNECMKEVAIRACMTVMDKISNVRAYLSPNVKDDKQIVVKFEIGGKVSSLEEFKFGFESYVKLLIDAQSTFMKAGEEISKSQVEAGRKSKKIGFYSPMKEKIDNFIKEHPTATADEVNKYIDSIR